MEDSQRTGEATLELGQDEFDGRSSSGSGRNDVRADSTTFFEGEHKREEQQMSTPSPPSNAEVPATHPDDATSCYNHQECVGMR